ncbi:MAG: thioredoxin fold domain-containing protein [bacterium]|nr:thioredoxin fold domain-containing protein [bacterium]
MKYTIIALFALLCIIHAVEIQREDGVMVLTEENFSDAIKENKFLLVKFYAPWCGHCKKLAPEFAKAAAILAKDDPPLNIGKVDATVHKELGKKYDVSGYPSLKFFVDGNPTEYNGGRTEPEIVSWLRKKTGPPSKEFTAASDVEAWNNSNEVGLVFFGSNAELFEVFQNVARSNDDVSFGYCSTDECLTHFNAKHGQVTIFKKFDEKRNDLTEPFTSDSLSGFIIKFSSPKVMKFDEKCAQLIFGKATPGIFFYRDPNSSDANKWQEMAAALSEKLGVNIFFNNLGKTQSHCYRYH